MLIPKSDGVAETTASGPALELELERRQLARRDTKAASVTAKTMLATFETADASYRPSGGAVDGLSEEERAHLDEIFGAEHDDDETEGETK